jgi:hypothetical protein
MKKVTVRLALSLLAMCFLFEGAHASTDKDLKTYQEHKRNLENIVVRKAPGKKNNTYYQSGVVVGGNAQIQDGSLNGLRRGLSKNGYERIVIDTGDGSEIGYFHVSLPEPSRSKSLITVTLKGVHKLNLNEKKLKKHFSKSNYVRRVNIYPILSAKEAVLEIELKEEVPVEIFKLNKPGRLVMDLKVVPSA